MFQFIANTPEVLNYQNFNLKDIVTPLKVDIYAKLLKEANYDVVKTQNLVNGITKGFSLEYNGPKRVSRKARNLPMREGDKYEIWNKVINKCITRITSNLFLLCSTHSTLFEIDSDTVIQSHKLS